ncbi:SDR family NAD(P)-dependent oxidoreductase [Aspergillus affinis]|uniref:SDR family NAD(P)-dependent oxidoreductase n=1 Tax=Aspergillus affinis TaxID=1070780 RepID=UPI0022FEDE97|nr:uncharacterized protein KD926_001213 [Aspergillus affinis]KAI9036898.1 hypothetical protein KD926_001213 [Aspergillus affinis]
MSLAGKIAIVTGASRGIGASIAIELAKQGAYITLTHSSPSSGPEIEAVVATISALNTGARTNIVLADLTCPDSASKILTSTLSAFPAPDSKIDILINNAAVFHCAPLPATTPSDILNLFALNVHGTILLTRAVLPNLRAPGRIINLSSVAARRGSLGGSIYAATKAAVEGFTRALAFEIGIKDGHTVNVVAPGVTESRMLREQVPVELTDFMKLSTPLQQRVGRTEEVAKVVLFLVGRDAGWVTGQTVCVSGGLNMI